MDSYCHPDSAEVSATFVKPADRQACVTLFVPAAGVALLGDLDFHGGRGLVHARAAGVRAARALRELMHHHERTEVAEVQVDGAWLTDRHGGELTWVARAHDATGRSLPGAALLAVTVAAVTLRDLLSGHGIDGLAMTAPAFADADVEVDDALFEDEITNVDDRRLPPYDDLAKTRAD